jgi:hypothetical protein
MAISTPLYGHETRVKSKSFTKTEAAKMKLLRHIKGYISLDKTENEYL